MTCPALRSGRHVGAALRRPELAELAADAEAQLPAGVTWTGEIVAHPPLAARLCGFDDAERRAPGERAAAFVTAVRGG